MPAPSSMEVLISLPHMTGVLNMQRIGDVGRCLFKRLHDGTNVRIELTPDQQRRLEEAIEHLGNFQEIDLTYLIAKSPDQTFSESHPQIQKLRELAEEVLGSNNYHWKHYSSGDSIHQKGCANLSKQDPRLATLQTLTPKDFQTLFDRKKSHREDQIKLLKRDKMTQTLVSQMRRHLQKALQPDNAALAEKIKRALEKLKGIDPFALSCAALFRDEFPDQKAELIYHLIQERPRPRNGVHPEKEQEYAKQISLSLAQTRADSVAYQKKWSVSPADLSVERFIVELTRQIETEEREEPNRLNSLFQATFGFLPEELGDSFQNAFATLIYKLEEACKGRTPHCPDKGASVESLKRAVDNFFDKLRFDPPAQPHGRVAE